MYPAEFEYEKPTTVDDAVDLLASNTDRDAHLLAGGHSLLPTMKSGLASPALLIDIGGIEALAGITDNGETSTIGAMTPYAEIDGSDHLETACPIIAEAAREVGDRQVRNAGTIGGNIAHADPASDMPASVLAADGTIHARGPDGDRTIPADEFFIGMYGTALDHDEILTAIEVPNVSNGTADAYRKKASPSSGYAQVGVAARVSATDGTVDACRVAVNGAVDHAFRLTDVEETIRDEPFTTETIENAKAAVSSDLDGETVMDDNQVSAEFREQLVRVYCERALLDVKARLS